MKSLQNQIKDIMDKKNITSYQMSKDIGLNESQLSKFFRGEANFSLNKLFNVLEYLECEIKIIEKT